MYVVLSSDCACPVLHFTAQVGKTSLIKGLVKHYTKQNLADPLGPITLVTGTFLGVAAAAAAAVIPRTSSTCSLRSITATSCCGNHSSSSRPAGL
jgi:hypothetical protein